MSSLGQKVAMAVGALGGLGFGGYFAVQMQEVRKYEKDRHDIQNLIDAEQKKLKRATQQQAEAEQTISDLTSATEDRKKAIADLEIKLDAARKQVQQLEQQLKGKGDELRTKQADLQKAHSRLAELRSEAERAKQSVSMSERSLALAAAKVAEAKQLTNPLNHPKVKELLGKK